MSKYDAAKEYLQDKGYTIDEIVEELGSIFGADGRILSSIAEEKLWYMLYKVYIAQIARIVNPNEYQKAIEYFIKRYNNHVISGRWGNQYLLQFE